MARNSTYMYKLNDYKINLFFFLIIWNFISQDCSGKVYSRVGNKHQWQDVGRAPENMPQRNQQRVEV